jgi:hypothetical protein
LKRAIFAAAGPTVSQYKRNCYEEPDMQIPSIIMLALLGLAAQVHAKPDCDALACDEVKQAIREIEARMRAGYSRPQGERFEARLRKLKRKRSKLCR